MAPRNPFGSNYERHPMTQPIWGQMEAMQAKIELLEKTLSIVFFVKIFKTMNSRL